MSEKEAKTRTAKRPLVMTIGHSTRTGEELVHELRSHGVKLLVDVRTIPKSRTNPQFNMDVLCEWLPKSGIAYKHMKVLGGLRKAKADSKNSVWENASFRGYADYMETEAFREGVDELLKMAAKKRLAIMCSEAVWWRCHRSMIADELVARGIPVEHIMTGERTQPHKLRSFAHVEDDHVSYS